MTVSLTEPFLNSSPSSVFPGLISKVIKMMSVLSAIRVLPNLDSSSTHAQPPSITSLVLRAFSPSPPRDRDPDQVGLCHLLSQEDLPPYQLSVNTSISERNPSYRQRLPSSLYTLSPFLEIIPRTYSCPLAQVCIEPQSASHTISCRSVEINQELLYFTRCAIHSLRSLKEPKAPPGLLSKRRGLPPPCSIDANSFHSGDSSQNSSKPTQRVTALHRPKWSLHLDSSNRETERRPTLLVNFYFSSKFFTDSVLLDRFSGWTPPPSLLCPLLPNYQSLPLGLTTSKLSLFCPVSLLPPFAMADQPAQQNPPEPAINIDGIFSKDCTMCKTHTFMINRLRSKLQELKEDYESDSRSKRKKLEKQKAEIENLQGRCSHLEEAMEHIRTLTQSFQAEASTKASGARRDPIPDISVTQKTPYDL